jgi:hypothetical protein
LPGFLSDLKNPKIHVATFNTTGKVITFKQASTAGVVQAFKGISAGGGTDHGSGIRALANFKPKEDEDAVFLFIGDEGQYGTFTDRVRESVLNTVAFGLIKVGEQGSDIRDTAVNLGIPCFMVNENTFSDPYSVPRVLRNLIASTPVGKKDVANTKYHGSVLEVQDAVQVDSGVLNAINFTGYGSSQSVNDVYHYTEEALDVLALAGQAGRVLLSDIDGGNDWINAAAMSHNLVLSLQAGAST